jgi:hypothetical protein
MKRGLLLFERVILESLVRSSKNLQDLSVDVGINQEVLNKIINMLISRNLIITKDKKYLLSIHNMSGLESVNCKSFVEKEVGELLLNSVLDYYNHRKKEDTFLSIKKTSMTLCETMEFNKILNNLEEFIKVVELKNKNRGKVKDQKVIFYGYNIYKNLVRRSLS